MRQTDSTIAPHPETGGLPGAVLRRVLDHIGANVHRSRGNPVTLGTLRPGTYVTINGGQPVILRDGQYVPAPAD